MNSKKAWFIFFPFIMVALIFSVQCRTSSDSISREQLIIQTLFKQSQNFHYNPVKVDDDFSKKAFHDFLDNMDPGKRFLTKKDLQSIEKYKTLLDDYFKNGSLEFLQNFHEILMRSVNKTEAYYKDILSQDLLQGSSNETIEIDPEKREWASDDKELKKLWNQSIRYDFNSRYYEAMSDLEKDKKTRPQDSIVMEIKKDIQESYENYFERIRSSKESDRFEVYVNTLLHLYDPHTEYFSPRDKENFNITMSGKLEGIGARLTTEKEYTKVASIVPGGPAWKQKELEANDIIMAVKQDKEEFVDIKGMNIDDVVKQIRGKKGTSVTLKVKKSNNDIKEITIVREEVIMDEGYARSAIVTTDSLSEKVGYLRLPRFYADFESSNGVSCAKDVAKELKKLIAEGAKSLVFDLRNNGGGSLQEVVEMAGLFIKDGSVVQVRDREKVIPYNDTDDRVVFDGPVAVLINSNSASASEILAACLQDYKRAVIIGGENTFGKGTVQRFINLDRIPGYDQFKPLGELKITIQKYYRVSGGSVQLKGVEPDILIPDIYRYLDNGEKEYEHPLEYDVIAPNTTAKVDNPVQNYSELKGNSQMRIASIPEFKLIDEQAQRYKKMKDDSTFPLQYNQFKTLMDKRKEESKKFEQIGKSELSNLIAYNLNTDKNYINSDSSRIGRNEDFIKNIRKDLAILESLNVLKDIKN